MALSPAFIDAEIARIRQMEGVSKKEKELRISTWESMRQYADPNAKPPAHLRKRAQFAKKRTSEKQ